MNDKALFVDCRPRGTCYHTAHVPLPEGHLLVVMDSGQRHQSTGPLFNQRVAEVQLGVRLLRERYPGITHLRDMEGVPWEEYAGLLPEGVTLAELESRGIALSDLVQGGIAPQAERLLVRQRCRHVVTENARVLATIGALRAGDLGALGGLMAASHASARDDYGISTPRLDALVALATEQLGVVGARITGAGWGGCAVALARAEAAEPLVARVAQHAHTVGDRAIRAYISRPAPGAGYLSTIQTQGDPDDPTQDR